MNIVFYTAHCPRCVVLKKKLDSKNIGYDVIDDIDKIQQDGFSTVPVLVVDGKTMFFEEAIRFVNNM